MLDFTHFLFCARVRKLNKPQREHAIEEVRNHQKKKERKKERVGLAIHIMSTINEFGFVCATLLFDVDMPC